MSASPEKLHELLTYCMDFGAVMLKDAGEFYPFGATLNSDGNVAAVAGFDGEDYPAPQDIYRLLADSFVSSAANGSITAAALAINVNIPSEYNPPSRDGIRVLIESEGFARLIYVPYTIKAPGLFRRSYTVSLLEPIPVEVEPELFPRESNA